MKLYQDTSCSVEPYSTSEVSSPDECCNNCQEDPECQGWTYEEARGTCHFSLGAGVVFTKAQGSTCGTNIPPHGPTPVDPAFDCRIRSLALEYAQAVLPGDHTASLSEALQLKAAHCGAGGAAAAGLRREGGHSSTADGVQYFVDPAHGDDAAPGTSAAAAWRTLQRAADMLAEAGPDGRPRTTINLMAGVHVLEDTLELGYQHSGASADAPVIWAAAPGATPGDVVVSGGLPLRDLQWQSADAAGVYYAKLPEKPRGPVESLFADGQRQFRARWPNGNPETFCARDLHGGHCQGYAQASQTRTEGTAAPGTSLGKNVKVYAKESGELIAEGVMNPLHTKHEFEVSVPTEAWHKRKPTFSTFEAYEGGAIDRFDTSVTKAYWNSDTPLDMYYDKGNFTDKVWAKPGQAMVHTYQSEYWGSWSFQLESVDHASGHFKFSRGGFQEARGGSIGGKGLRGILQDYYVENVFEELDAPREWYFDHDTSTLYFAPPHGRPPAADLPLYLPQMETILAARGASQAKPVRHVRLRGLTFAHALPGIMQAHEPTTGGDWAVRRAAALVIENAVGVVVEGCLVHQVEGNGILLSRFVRDSVVTRSEVAGVGDTPVLLLGAADLMDGRAGNYPFGNEVSHNYLHHFGVWNRQAAGYFEGVSRRNNVSYNVIHDGPRAGANFNDGFGGGLTFEGNLLFNVVQDTGEHGTTNSWDRAPMLWLDDNGEVSSVPETRRIARNFVFRNSFRGPTSNQWVLDKDDGSSNYLEEGNVLVYGAVKDRDGLQRDVVGNLFLYPDKMPFKDTTNTFSVVAFQVNGFQFDSFVNNTVISDMGIIYDCSKAFSKQPRPLGTPTMRGNTFITPGNDELPFDVGSCAEASNFRDWQDLGYDEGSTQSSMAVPTDDAIAMARTWLPLLGLQESRAQLDASVPGRHPHGNMRTPSRPFLAPVPGRHHSVVT